ncbi:Rossmann-like and DUF2520 domain-containing protein [Roseivirga sp. E12]|uniref:Rossmann-like and DUF2520 domain-containing protein n=1 Tax=Roseivirga sp. E12 TaxID=2819237 RepID=UPI001ABD370B|nr:Rossmann-like and DUF2520 domain-containing protein [Roseivirga sp. E12]MBO3698968.1 DUF2520 domain-containing protein [Roseivirga sp. E12]
MKSQRIAILGTGNVAWHLSRTLENSGHVISHIYDRDIAKAEKFAMDYFNASTGDKLDFSALNASLFIMAISDDSIEEVAQELELPDNSTLVHTSGTVPLNALGYTQTHNIGVFYPLQTFSKGKDLDFTNIPICIEGESEETIELLRGIANSISHSVHILNSSQRKVIHLSAVFACNFTNHMFTVSKEILASNDLNFELLKPLIVETLNKSFDISPENAQTGPAKRGDMETLDKQFDSLSNDPQVAEIYRLVSQHIIDFYQE